MPVFRTTVQAGGVSRTVSADFNEDRELKYQLARGLCNLAQELEIAGYLTVGPKVNDGDYVRRTVTLTIPDGV